MAKIILVHGWGGSAQSDWLPWAATELRKLGHEVIAPNFPNTDEPKIKEWVPFLTQTVGTPDEKTYFIGGSIGCQTILRYLETIERPIGGAVFVAGWFKLENLENEEEERIARPWVETPLDFAKIKQVLPRSTLIISGNDPFGAFDDNKQKFAELGSKIVVLPNAGHITGEDGYTQLPELIAEFKNLIY